VAAFERPLLPVLAEGETKSHHDPSRKQDAQMKHIATIALMLILGVTNVYAHENRVKMKFSGTSAASTINLQQPDPSNLQQPATNNDEDNFAGNGTLGSFTFRNIRAIAANPTTSSTCSGANQFYFQELAGAGVFRFEDGSLLYVRLTQGSDCIDFTALEAHCTMTLEVTGGTGRFRNASGAVVRQNAIRARS
jgi:hypothetical protein